MDIGVRLVPSASLFSPPLPLSSTALETHVPADCPWGQPYRDPKKGPQRNMLSLQGSCLVSIKLKDVPKRCVHTPGPRSDDVSCWTFEGTVYKRAVSRLRD